MNTEMHFKAKTTAKTYFSSFGKLFGEFPNFPSEKAKDEAFKTIETIILNGFEKYGDDPALKHIIECDVLDKMEELINTYK